MYSVPKKFKANSLKRPKNYWKNGTEMIIRIHRICVVWSTAKITSKLTWQWFHRLNLTPKIIIQFADASQRCWRVRILPSEENLIPKTNILDQPFWSMSNQLMQLCVKKFSDQFCQLWTLKMHSKPFSSLMTEIWHWRCTCLQKRKRSRSCSWIQPDLEVCQLMTPLCCSPVRIATIYPV